MTERDLVILREIANVVSSSVHELLGTNESGRIVGSGYGGDKTKLIDDVAEKAIIHYLQRERLSCTFIGEERGIMGIGEKPRFFLITDAVDGTTNAIRGICFASTSLAISRSDSFSGLEAAIVMDLFDGTIYEAERQKGAKCNGKTISPSTIKSLRDSVLSINMSRNPSLVETSAPFIHAAKAIRSLGSAALEICLVSSGLLEAYIDLRAALRTTDIAASVLILNEAGGVVLQPNGEGFEDFSLTKLNRFSLIAAANKQIYEETITAYQTT